MADNLDFQGLTKHEPLLIHIGKVVLTSIERPNKFSQLQYRLFVENIKVYESNLLWEISLSKWQGHSHFHSVDPEAK
jgi:hypothetical protein